MRLPVFAILIGLLGGCWLSVAAVRVADRLLNTVPDGGNGGLINGLSPDKDQAHIAAVDALFGMLRGGVRSRTILTRHAFENAITVVYALGGSTNFILHILALAREAKVALSSSVLCLVTSNPSGRSLRLLACCLLESAMLMVY